MGIVEHAQQLRFLRSTLNRKNDTSPKKESAINFTCFVYFQCFPKIQQRRTLAVTLGRPQFRTSWVSVKLNMVGCAHDSTNYLVPNLQYGDGRITDYWKFCNRKGSVFEEHDGRKYLIYTKQVSVILHKTIRQMIKLLCADLQRVLSARQGNNRNITDCHIKSVEGALDGVHYCMRFFASLVRGPCFWKLIRHPLGV